MKKISFLIVGLLTLLFFPIISKGPPKEEPKKRKKKHFFGLHVLEQEAKDVDVDSSNNTQN